MEHRATLVRNIWKAARRYIRVIAGGFALAFILLAGGCAQKPEITTSSTRKSVAAESAFVIPPVGGPAVVGVIERVRSSSIDQEILLANNSKTTGQNSFRVRVAAHANSGIDSSTKFISDMRAALPGIGMRKSPYFVQNRYGPFGYAVGRSGNTDLCLYSWQRIKTTATLLSNQGLIDVRLRLCETGATEQQLLSVVYGYTIDAFFGDRGWNPYGDPAAPSATLGARGPEVYPLGATRFATVIEPLPKSAPKRVRVAKAPEPDPQPPAAEVRDGPHVPPPPHPADAGTPRAALLPKPETISPDEPIPADVPIVPKPPTTTN